jgi:hypothetical protein
MPDCSCRSSSTAGVFLGSTFANAVAAEKTIRLICEIPDGDSIQFDGVGECWGKDADKFRNIEKCSPPGTE